MNASFDPLHLVNTYGAFGSITRERYEVVIEGTDDADHGRTRGWREYEFKGKPGDPHRRPPQFAPYHLRLDWLMWFAAHLPGLRPTAGSVPLVDRLLEGDAATLRLLRHNPFPRRPAGAGPGPPLPLPLHHPAERRATGDWWSRHLLGEYLPPLRLDPLSGGRAASARARRNGRRR